MPWFNLTIQIQVVRFELGFWWAIFQSFNLLLYLIFVFSCLITFSQKIYSRCLFISACSVVFETPDVSSVLQKYRFLFIFIPYFPHSLLIYALIWSSFREMTVLSPLQHLFFFEQEYRQSLYHFTFSHREKYLDGVWLQSFFKIFVKCKVNPSSTHENRCTWFHTLRAISSVLNLW